MAVEDTKSSVATKRRALESMEDARTREELIMLATREMKQAPSPRQLPWMHFSSPSSEREGLMKRGRPFSGGCWPTSKPRRLSRLQAAGAGEAPPAEDEELNGDIFNRASSDENHESSGVAQNVDEMTAGQSTHIPTSSHCSPPDDQAGHENPPAAAGGKVRPPGEGDDASDPG